MLEKTPGKEKLLSRELKVKNEATKPICEERRFDQNLKYNFKEQSTQQNQITPGYCPCDEICSHKHAALKSKSGQLD